MKRNIAGLILSGLMVVLLIACEEIDAGAGAPPETITLEDGVTYIVIAEESDFEKMRDDPTGNYYLWRDVALTEDFDPIAHNIAAKGKFEGTPFTGIFDGGGHKISNLGIAKSDENFVGLFGQIGHPKEFDLDHSDANGVVRNLTLVLAAGSEDDPSVEGVWSIGALAGRSYGKIEAAGVEGGVVKGTGKAVGRLVGSNHGLITSSYATGLVTGSSQVGGLVGWTANTATIEKSYATGKVKGTKNAGGLVGFSNGDITSSYATGSVTGSSQVGGLVGNASGDITSSYATGSVTGSRGYVGGLVGVALYNSSITSSYATGSVTVEAEGIDSNVSVGGLVGFSNGDITSSYATVSVTVEAEGIDSNVSVGGLVGFSNGDITSSYATGSVTGTGSNVGGLVGYTSGDITSSYATGSVTVEAEGIDSNVSVGGLVGYTSGDITSSYATGSVTVEAEGIDSNVSVGGLVGYTSGDITSSYATGSVTVEAEGIDSNVSVGGLVGRAWRTITSSYFDTSSTIMVNGVELNSLQGIGRDDNSQSGNVTGYHTDDNNTPDVLGDDTVKNNGVAVTQSDFVDDPSTIDYVEWDFDAVWRWVADGQWPLLAWQLEQ